jgi:hypothetical protein
LGNAAAGGGGKGEEVGEVFSCVFFDEGEDGRDLIDVGLGLLVCGVGRKEGRVDRGCTFVLRVARRSSLTRPTWHIY